MTPREQQQAKRIKELLARIEVLEETLDAMKEAFAEELPELLGLVLTPSQRTICGLLMRRELVTKSLIMATLYSDRPDTAPEPKIADVYVCKIRSQLRPFGIGIETVWAVGWRMTPADRERLRALSAADRPETVSVIQQVDQAS